MIELNRDDEQYLAVENFEDYELTYCMAYEMAIRNDEVIKTIYSFYNNYVIYDIHNGFIASTSDFKKCSEDSNKLMGFLLNPLELYLSYHLFKNINEDIEKLNELYNEKDGSFPIHRLKNILYSPWDSYNDFREYIPNKKLIEQKFRKRYTSFISHLVSEDNNDEFIIHHNSITPNYSRPLTPYFSDIKERNLKLNLSLPTNELVDFVQKLKKDYDRDHSFFGTVKELEGESLQEADKTDNVLSSQMKLADMLYLYDCLKLGYSKAEIKVSISIYYRSKDIKTKSLHHATFTKYQKIMIDYIDNFKYKELVLGTR